MIYSHNVFFNKEDVGYLKDLHTEWTPCMVSKTDTEGNVISAETSSDNSFSSSKLHKKGSYFYNRVKEYLTQIKEELVADEILVMLVHYKVGGYIHRHNDKNVDYPDRRYAICIQLSEGDDYEGGDFFLYPDRYPEEFKRDLGNAIIFDNNLEHEVTRVKSGSRYSCVIFLDNKDVIVRKSAI